jgi:ABC-type transport system involved in multi-copper enzyme maturation permease subunit
MDLTRIRTHFSLPLLEKELIEQAARKRTYLVRVGYACLLFLVAFLIFYQELQAGATSPLAVLGRGRDMFNSLVLLEFAGVYLFMPAITCGVLTQEKERESLQLLLITRLGPWTILFEKLLGRLVPMVCFLLLSLPLLGFAYSLGGISPRLLWTGVWMLILAVVQMGTLALACSAFFRTTVAAFVTTYIVAFLMFFGPFVTWMLLYLIGYLLGIDFDAVERLFGSSISQGTIFLGMFPFFGPPLFGIYTSVGGPGTWPLVAHSVIVLGASGLCLVLARRYVVSRAFAAPRNILLEFFKFLDQRSSRRGMAGRKPGTASASNPTLLPADEPIAWRELTKRTLGRARYLVRILIFTEVPLVIFCAILVAAEFVSESQYTFVPRMLVTLTMFIFWALAVLVISVQAASLIAGERSHQTLDVLCTSPLTGREIVLQKFQSVRRMILVFVLPFATIVAAESCVREIAAHRVNWMHENFNAPLYLTCSVLTLVIYLPLVAWLSLAIGLKVRTQARAMIGSMAAIVAWCVVPYIVVVMPLAITFQNRGSSDDPVLSCTMLLSPASILFWNEFDTNVVWRDFGEYLWVPVVLNFGGYLAALVFFRRMCLKNADRWLGRTADQSPDAVSVGGPLSGIRTWLGTMERDE